MPQQPPYLSIAKDAIARMPLVTFSGKITVVDTEEKAHQALDYLEQQPIVGFDTETRPSFRKGVTHKVALIQISTDDHCYLFRINITGVIDRLRRFLENDSIVKVGLSLKDDFLVLHKVSDMLPLGFIDLQHFVGDYAIADASLQRIYAIIFQQRISKSQRLTNWEDQNLSDAQQHYAAIDAWACLRIYNHLTSGNFNPEQSPYRIIESQQ